MSFFFLERNRFILLEETAASVVKDCKGIWRIRDEHNIDSPENVFDFSFISQLENAHFKLKQIFLIWVVTYCFQKLLTVFEWSNGDGFMEKSFLLELVNYLFQERWLVLPVDEIRMTKKKVNVRREILSSPKKIVKITFKIIFKNSNKNVTYKTHNNLSEYYCRHCKWLLQLSSSFGPFHSYF